MSNPIRKIRPLLIILLIVPFLALSFIFVHLFAVLGIFIAIAYPIWWILFPRQTPCFFCRLSDPGEKCVACKETVIEENYTPKNFGSIIKNSLFIVLITAISIGAVYIEQLVIEKAGIQITQPKVEFIIQDKMQYKIGEIFPIDLNINSNGVYVNAVQADIGFNPEKIQIEKISLDNSFANIFIQQEINNEDGYMRLTGGLPSPGYNGEKGHFATVYFKSKQAGLFEIQFLPSSMVLANDGNGTNVLKSYPKSSYLIKPEYVTETEQELQTQMLQASNVLGINNQKDQMIFFDSYASNVLGATDIDTNYETEPETARLSCWQILLIIDEWILNIISKIFSFI